MPIQHSALIPESQRTVTAGLGWSRRSHCVCLVLCGFGLVSAGFVVLCWFCAGLCWSLPASLFCAGFVLVSAGLCWFCAGLSWSLPDSAVFAVLCHIVLCWSLRVSAGLWQQWSLVSFECHGGDNSNG